MSIIRPALFGSSTKAWRKSPIACGYLPWRGRALPVIRSSGTPLERIARHL